MDLRGMMKDEKFTNQKSDEGNFSKGFYKTDVFQTSGDRLIPRNAIVSYFLTKQTSGNPLTVSLKI